MLKKYAFNKALFTLWTRRTIGVALPASYLLAAYAIISMQIIPTAYLLIALVVGGGVIALVARVHFKKFAPGFKSIVFIILSILLIGLNFYIFSAGQATSSFLQAIEDKGYTYEEYSIIAKKDRHLLLTGNAVSSALLDKDQSTDAVKTEVNKRTKATYKNYADLTSLTLGVSKNDTDIATLKSSYVQLLEENNASFYQSIDVIDTFKIKVQVSASATKTDTNNPFILYISGIDTYGEISSVSRSDVNILAVINPQTHKILLVNTPRDYYVQLHGTAGTKDKLTHAGIYGIDMSINTLEDLYGTNIDYYMRVNFASLLNIVDSLGGVSVYSETTFTAGKYSYQAGYNDLNGEQALAFSRERHAFEDGDRTRGKNQQRVIEAIIHKLSSPSTLINYQDILKSFSGALQTNASSDEIAMLINKQLNNLRKWQVESISVDGTGKTAPTYSMGSLPLYVMEPDPSTLHTAKQKIKLYVEK